VHLTDKGLESARSSLQRLDECVPNLSGVSTSGPRAPELAGWIATMKEGVREALFDDINMSAVLAASFRLVRQANYLIRVCDEITVSSHLFRLGRMV
jgi:cysteinyl-tRNA synthetase